MNIIQRLEAGTILSIYKPLEWTSFDVIRKLKGLLGRHIPKFKIGHAGTLDPLAEGLLIICTQKMTKQVDAIHSLKKTYIANIFLGATRPSYDKETEIDQTFDISHIDETMVRDILSKFKGIQQQTPPIHSAVKKDGKPVYLKARKGIDVSISSKEIEIYDIELLEFNLPTIRIKTTVSKGTYIRTLAKDIGEKLNSGAYLDHLIRTQIGEYTIENALSILEIEAKIKEIERHASL